ncbi:MAG: type II toxin-antitoxin system HicA family toxin [bacterium]
MIAKLPILSGREVVKIFEAFGWEKARQSGSHIILVKPGEIASLSVPDHKEIAAGKLRSLMKAAGLSAEEFIKMMR